MTKESQKWYEELSADYQAKTMELHLQQQQFNNKMGSLMDELDDYKSNLMRINKER